MWAVISPMKKTGRIANQSAAWPEWACGTSVNTSAATIAIAAIHCHTRRCRFSIKETRLVIGSIAMFCEGGPLRRLGAPSIQLFKRLRCRTEQLWTYCRPTVSNQVVISELAVIRPGLTSSTANLPDLVYIRPFP